MAQMYPNPMAADVESEAEKLLYGLFNQKLMTFHCNATGFHGFSRIQVKMQRKVKQNFSCSS